MLLGAFLSLHAKSFRACILMGLRSRSRQTSQFVPETSHEQKGLELFSYKLLFIIRLIYTIWFMCFISYSNEHANEILSLFYSCCEIIEIKDQTSA